MLFKNATIIDGTGKEAFLGNVVVRDGRIEAVIKTGRNDEPVDETQNEKNCKGLRCVPGFIDIHTHSDYDLLVDPRGEGKLAQGVTLDVGGNCGISAAPIGGKHREEQFQYYQQHYGKTFGWSSMQEFFTEVEKEKRGINLAALVGYNTVRASVTGIVDRPPTGKEMFEIEGLIEEGLDSGACGLSLGLIYPPAVYAKEQELVDVAKVVARKGKVLTAHIRNEGKQVEAAVEEILNIARKNGVALQISHLKAAGKVNWHKVDNLFSLIEAAREEGVDVQCDRYPYTAAKTGLRSILPPYSYEGGNKSTVERLSGKTQRAEIRKWILNDIYGPEYWETVMVSQVSTEKNRIYEGKRVQEAADETGVEPVDFLLDLLIEEKMQVEGVYFSMNENNLRKILQKDYVMVGSDAGAKGFDGLLKEGRPHPRGYGSFPRVIAKYVKDGTLREEEAIKKMTSMPAERLGFKNRGYVKPGCAADLVFYDFAAIEDKADFLNPFQKPEGIQEVYVAGELAYKNNKIVSLHGQSVKNNRSGTSSLHL